MRKTIYLLIFSGLLLSCNTRKNVVYFQTDLADSSKTNYTPTFKIDDLLSIYIMSDNLEASKPFNLPLTNNNTNNAGYSVGNPERMGYLIDNNGFVNLPILGAVELSGLKRTEAVELLEKKLQEYLNNPVVHIQILNYKITVLGDVAKPGTFKIPNERITVLEALGLSGDMKITGKRKNIMVLREENGKTQQYHFDLTNSQEVFNSPIYYLQQNDVVYVEPNMSSRTSGAFWRTAGSIFISTAGVIISTISVLSK